MNTFESELRNGRFVISHCQNCEKITWPPNDFCNNCFGKVSWRKIREPGTVIECSSKDGKSFCMAEFEGTVRIIGTVSSPDPRPGQKIVITSCGFDKEPRFVFSVE